MARLHMKRKLTRTEKRIKSIHKLELDKLEVANMLRPFGPHPFHDIPKINPKNYR